MKRGLCGWLLVYGLLGSGFAVAPKGKSTFLVKGFSNNEIIIQPIITPVFGVWPESDVPLAKGEVLTCETKARTTEILVNGEKGSATETILECGEEKRTFKLRTVYFDAVKF